MKTHIFGSIAIACYAQSIVGCGDGEPKRVSSAVTTAPLEDNDPPPGTIHSLEVVDGVVTRSFTYAISADAIRQEAPGYIKAPPLPRRQPPKIDPDLERDVDAAAADTVVKVVATFRDQVRIPRFPSPNESATRESDENRMVLERNRGIISDIEKTRSSQYQKRDAEFGANYGARVLHTFWLIDGMVLELPLRQVRSLASRSDVLYVERVDKNVPLPTIPMSFARSFMNTDPYFSLPQPTSWIGILDSGVRFTHTLLANNGGFLRDCLWGCANGCATKCPGASGVSNPNDVHTGGGHGTSTMSIISGNANLGANSRGFTPIVVDSYRVGTELGMDIPASIRGFQAAVEMSDRVIVAELQDPLGSDSSGLSAAADAAFDAGAVVVAAAGNFGPNLNTVTAPGMAAKVLTVGEADSAYENATSISGRGPTADGRTKPDLLGASDIAAAGNVSDTGLRVYNGTSCATPTVASAAALIRNFFRSSSGSPFEFPPAYVNALMIMFGRNTLNAANDQNRGAGVPQLLPTNAVYFYGVVNVSQGAIVEIPLNISSPSNGVDAAIWWPEPPNQTHSDVDLVLRNPNGVGVGSEGILGVFEKVRATTNLVSGVWKLRIIGFNLQGVQAVYFAVARR